MEKRYKYMDGYLSRDLLYQKIHPLRDAAFGADCLKGGGDCLFLSVATRFKKKHHKAKTIDHRVVKYTFLECFDHKLYRNIKIISIDGTSQKLCFL